MHLKATITKCTKIFFGDIRRAIVSCIVSSLILAGGGVVTFAKTARDWLIQTSNTPIPLWLTIVLVPLCSLGTYLIARRSLAGKIPLDPPAKTILIEAGRFKWKTDVYKTGEFKIHSVPYCPTHETRLVEYQRAYACPAIQLGCKSIIKRPDLKLQQDIAHSFIEHKLKEK